MCAYVADWVLNLLYVCVPTSTVRISWPRYSGQPFIRSILITKNINLTGEQITVEATRPQTSAHPLSLSHIFTLLWRHVPQFYERRRRKRVPQVYLNIGCHNPRSPMEIYVWKPLIVLSISHISLTIPNTQHVTEHECSLSHMTCLMSLCWFLCSVLGPGPLAH